MSKIILVNAQGPEKRVALLENSVLAEFYVERSAAESIVGNVYKGRVLRVLPGMQAAFIDIGLPKAAFLYVADVRGASPTHDEERLLYFAAIEREGREELFQEELASAMQLAPIQERIHEGQTILVQVAKEPIGTKGPRITSYISLPGRHLVYMPNVDHIGISRRIVNEAERKRLREIVEQIRAPGAGYIVRTVAEGQSAETLRADMEFLHHQWEVILERNEREKPPALLYQDFDLIQRTIRDLYSADVDKLIVDDFEEYERLSNFVAAYMPLQQGVVEMYNGREPMFDAYGVEMELDRALERKVWLKSGGYLIFDQKEALTSVDVNTGRYVGRRNLEDTIVKTNLEAVKETAHQLRLRNIGGIIVVDFIDMERETDREKVWRTLQEALREDRAKSNVLPISELGLVEMTRKRVRESLVQQLTETCPYCEGKGYVKSTLTVCYEVLREIRRQADELPGDLIIVSAHPEVADLLAVSEHDHLAALERRFSKNIHVEARSTFHLEQYEINVHHQSEPPSSLDPDGLDDGASGASSLPK